MSSKLNNLRQLKEKIYKTVDKEQTKKEKEIKLYVYKIPYKMVNAAYRQLIRGNPRKIFCSISSLTNAFQRS